MSEMEKLFHVFDDTSGIIQKEQGLPYLEVLAETGENLFQQAVLQNVSDDVKDQLTKTYESIDINAANVEDIRKAFQLAVLKGMKEATQPNHEMTPDTVALFISYLVQKVAEGKNSFSVLDPSAGTGNLLTAILNGNKAVTASYAVDADDLLLRLAYVNANLQKHQIQFFHQDAIQPLLLDPVDVVVCDLPVGYYPNEDIAADYELNTQSERPFAHHLMIEQSLNHTLAGGFLFFLIPNGLFESGQAEALNAYIKNHAVVQGLLQLPLSMFKKEQNAKSIFMLQKKGPGVKPPSQALLADLPSFSKQHALQNMIQQIDAWFQKERTV